MTSTMIILAILVYMIVVIYVGFQYSNKSRSSDEFYLGGRKLGPYVTAMSAEASDMSSWLLMGLPGVALLTSGFAEAFWTAAGLAIGTYLNWLIVAKRLRQYSEKINASTIPDFFSNRFHDKSGMLLAISAIVIIVFFVPYTGSGFAAIGKLFNSLFGIDYHTALIVGGFVVAAYTVLGGFLAASTTDFIQSIVMTVALFVVLCFGVENAGGLQNVLDNIQPGYFSLTGTDGSYGALPIVSTLAWGLGYFGMPHILLRFMAIEDKAKLKVARRVGSIWVVISMAIAICIGIVGYTFATKEGLIGAEDFDSERIIIYMATAISKLDSFAAIIAGVILSGILASTMSTADSQMLAASSSVSENIVRRFFFKNMSQKTSMIVARATVLVIAVVAIFFAWDPESSVFEIVSFAWAGFGSAFSALILFALFWKRTNKWGALAGMVSGGGLAIVWKVWVRPLGGAWDIYELLPAFIVSAIAIVVVSLLTKAPEKEIIEEFEAAKLDA